MRIVVEKIEVRIAVVDDKLGSRKTITERLEAFFVQSNFNGVRFIIKTYESGALFLDSQDHYDLVLLDYEMPDKNGIQVATELELREIRPRVLFISGHDEITKPMQKATQLRVTAGFIFKSDSEKEFQFQVKHALKAILNAHWIAFQYYLVDNDPALERKREKRNYYDKRIDTRKISHIVSTAKDVVTIYTEDEAFTTTESLKKLFDKLPNGEFEYSDRRIIINLGFVHSIGKKAIYLITDDELSLTAVYRNVFQKSYDHYLLKGLGD